MVVALLERGADIHAEDSRQRTALHLATQRGHKEVVLGLLERGAALEWPGM